MKLSDLAADRATVPVTPYDGAEDAVKVTYRPGKLTPAAQEAVAQSMAGDDTMLLEWLAGRPGVKGVPKKGDDPGRDPILPIDGALVEWDLTGDDDKPLPITVDVLRGLPNVFIVRMVRAMFVGEAPGEAKPDA